MKKQLCFFALLAMCQLCNSQLIYEGGISPLTGRLRPAVSISPVYSLNQVEFSAPVTYEHGHNLNAGASLGYRMRSDQTSIFEGFVIHAGAGYSWHVKEAIKSGEVVNKIMPVVGIKFLQGNDARAAIWEFRYQGGTFLMLFGIRFN